MNINLQIAVNELAIGDPTQANHYVDVWGREMAAIHHPYLRRETHDINLAHSLRLMHVAISSPLSLDEKQQILGDASGIVEANADLYFTIGEHEEFVLNDERRMNVNED